MEAATVLAVQVVGCVLYYISHALFFVYALAAYVYLATKWDRAVIVLYLAWFAWLMWNTYVPHADIPLEAILGYSSLQWALGMVVVRRELPEFAARTNRAKGICLIAVVMGLVPFNYVGHQSIMALLELVGQSCAYTAYAYMAMQQLENRDPMTIVTISLWVLTSYWAVAMPLAIVFAMRAKNQKKVEDTVTPDAELGAFVRAWDPPAEKEPIVRGSILRAD